MRQFLHLNFFQIKLHCQTCILQQWKTGDWSHTRREACSMRKESPHCCTRKKSLLLLHMSWHIRLEGKALSFFLVIKQKCYEIHYFIGEGQREFHTGCRSKVNFLEPHNLFHHMNSSHFVDSGLEIW